MTDLANGFTQAQIAGCITPRRLELTLLPTEKCNFRCTYCYEDFLLGAMSNDVQTGVIRLVERRAETLDDLSLSWFGGEPLLAANVIRRISHACADMAAKHGFQFSGGMTTNAYKLSYDLFEELVGLRQDFFQISLDGWREQHNMTRRRADGAGTFDTIWKNLLAFRNSKQQFEILLRIHITDANVESLETLCAEIHREFGTDSRFRCNFQDIRDLGEDKNPAIVNISATEFKRASRLLQRILDGKADEPETESVVAEPASVVLGESAGGRRAYQVSESERYICYAAKPNHLLIRSNGRVGKCTVALNDPRNDVGEITPDGQVRIDKELMRLWYRGLEYLDIEQLACPIQGMPSVQWPTSRPAIPVQVV